MPTNQIVDVTLVTKKEFVTPEICTPYVQNVLTEDQLLTDALQARGIRVGRTSWDNPNFDWSETSYVLFRAIWDYYDRFSEFDAWLTRCQQATILINPYSIIKWNLDKHYLLELKKKNIAIPPTITLERGDNVSLKQTIQNCGWSQAILKPAIAGGARHTYLFDSHNADNYQQIFAQLIADEAMLVQEFQNQITQKGELSFMLFNGQFSHAILKKAKQGDFRVQDDYGGTVHSYDASPEEVSFAEHVVALCDELPVYARVDLMWNNESQLCVSELELIEPELWLRTSGQAADLFAESLVSYINR